MTVLDDSINDDGDTVTLTLSNPSGDGAYLIDATATGTIENNDPMPQAWLARFGRTVASQAVDAIGARIEGGGGSHVTVAGHALSLSGEPLGAEDTGEARDVLRALSVFDEPEATTQSMTGAEVLRASAFQLSSDGTHGAPSWTAWGRFATGGFEADVDGTRLDGTVSTGISRRRRRRRWLARRRRHQHDPRRRRVHPHRGRGPR